MLRWPVNDESGALVFQVTRQDTFRRSTAAPTKGEQELVPRLVSFKESIITTEKHLHAKQSKHFGGLLSLIRQTFLEKLK